MDDIFADGDVLSCRYPGFSSYKTSEPIHYTKRWFRSALILSTLNERVTSLMPGGSSACTAGWAEFTYREVSERGITTVALTRLPAILVGALNLPQEIRAVARRDLAEEPLASSARNIWGRKRVSVAAADRYRIVDYLEAGGDRATFAEIVDLAHSSNGDPLDAVLSLLANGFLQMRLGDGITPGATVRLGPLARSDKGANALRRATF